MAFFAAWRGAMRLKTRSSDDNLSMGLIYHPRAWQTSAPGSSAWVQPGPAPGNPANPPVRVEFGGQTTRDGAGVPEFALRSNTPACQARLLLASPDGSIHQPGDGRHSVRSGAIPTSREGRLGLKPQAFNFRCECLRCM